MSDYTPTWFEVRELVEHNTYLTADEFDRWLAQHDAEVRAAALREAADAFRDDARAVLSAVLGPRPGDGEGEHADPS